MVDGRKEVEKGQRDSITLKDGVATHSAVVAREEALEEVLVALAKEEPGEEPGKVNQERAECIGLTEHHRAILRVRIGRVELGVPSFS